MEHWFDPKRVKAEYEQGVAYKGRLGAKGLYEQNRVNERFMVGDQWHGARCGNDRPLVRHNVIRRIGDYKMAVVGAVPVTVNYTAEGSPMTLGTAERVRTLRAQMAAGEAGAVTPDDELALTMSALTDYFKTTAERVGFETLREQALRDAYVTGTGILYTYWDNTVPTGQTADAAGRFPICGDIACEVLDVENVYFGDPSCDDVQKQPYILVAQRRRVDEIVRLMKQHHRPAADIEKVTDEADHSTQAGDYGAVTQDGNRYALLLTKLYRYCDENGGSHIRAVQVCSGVTVRREWNTGLRLYPIAKFSWERRKNCVYGESEITYLIPNQIAINRMLTASVWAVMMMGMPILTVNGDIVQQPVTNEPGQVVKVFGNAADVQNALHYVNPPAFAPALDNNISSLIANTLIQSGANDAALGDVRPDNTSAILAVREAAERPLQTVQNRYYAFLEELARIWAEFWVTQYGHRMLKITDANGTWYLPFEAERYRDKLIRAHVDVGAATLWSEAESVRTLDNLFDRNVIDAVQYLKRLPRGAVPDVAALIHELQTPSLSEDEVLSGLSEHSRTVFEALPDDKKRQLLTNAMEVAR